MKNKRKYKFTAGIQQVTMDSPDKSKVYNYQTERAGQDYLMSNSLNALSGQYGSIAQMGGAAADFIKSKSKNKETGSTIGGALKMGASGAAMGATLGGPWGAAIGGTAGLIAGGVRGKQEAKEVARLEEVAQQEADTTNFNKGFKRDAATNVQQFVKKGRRKLKTKQPRLIETEGREPIFSPKKKDGTRDLLYYNPNDPTHEEGGVKAIVIPKHRYKYNNGASNLMPKRSKVSLLGSGMMAVGAKQLKVNNLNDAALSENLGGMPAVNAANKFVQPMAGINQVARNIPEARRKEKQNTPRSHKKVNPDLNKIVDPPMLYEMKPPPPRSTFNTKNDFKKGGSYIRTYQEGTEAAATYKHTKTFKSKPAYQAALQAHDDSLNLYGQSRYFTDKVKESGLYNSTVENPAVKNITRTGTGRTASPLKAYGAPDDASEEIMTIAGMNPMRKDLYSRKESKYKSFKEYEEAKAAGNPEKHEGYEINMYKHPEMALKYEPDTAQALQIKKPKLNVTKDTATVRRPRMVTNTTDTTSKQDKEVVALNKTRGKFVGREKTFFEKAGEFLDKVGPSNRMSNGKKVKVYK